MFDLIVKCPIDCQIMNQATEKDTQPAKEQGPAAWVRAAAPAKPKASPDPRLAGPPLGEILKSGPLMKWLEASEKGEVEFLNQKFQTNQLDDRYPSMSLIRMGATKQIFDAGDGKHVLLMKKSDKDSVLPELMSLSRLAKIGILPIGVADAGSINGKPAVVMEKLPATLKWSEHNAAAGRALLKNPLLNQNTADDLRKMADVLRLHQIVILGFEIGITSDGRVKVMEPLGVTGTYGEGLNNEEMVRSMERYAAKIEVRVPG